MACLRTTGQRAGQNHEQWPDQRRPDNHGRSRFSSAAEKGRRTSQQACNDETLRREDSRDNVNDEAVAAYQMSVQAGNPLSERKLAQMFGSNLPPLGASQDQPCPAGTASRGLPGDSGRLGLSRGNDSGNLRVMTCRLTEGRSLPGTSEAVTTVSPLCLHKGLLGLTRPC